MAISIIQEPLNYTPAYNDINFVVDSTNKTQPNFNYIFDIVINGSVVSRHRVPPRPSNNYGVFNAKRIVENYLSDVFDFTAFQVSYWNEGIVRLSVNLYEEYGTTPTIGSLSATSSNIYCWNASLDSPEYIDYAVTDYRQMTNQAQISQLLTNNLNQKIKLTERAFVYGLSGENNAITQFRVFAYNAAGTQIQYTIIPNPYATVSSVGYRMVSCPSGPDNLNSIVNANLDASTQNQGNIIPSNTATYFIFARGSNVSSIYTYYTIIDPCTKYTPVRLHFLNKLGGYDSFTFDLLSRTNNAIERKNYRKNLGELQGGSMVYSNTQRSNITFDTQVKETLILNSNWINDAEAIWLEELITSPSVYMQIGNDLEAISITDSAYEVKKTINDKLFNLTLNIEKTYIKTRQRG